MVDAPAPGNIDFLAQNCYFCGMVGVLCGGDVDSYSAVGSCSLVLGSW